MWKRLAVLWVATGIVIYFLFFYRIETHAVKLNMPTNGVVDPRQVEIDAERFTFAVGGVLLFALLAFFVWLNVRIIRRYWKAV